MTSIRIALHGRTGAEEQIRSAFPDAHIIDVPTTGAIPHDLRADVLFAAYGAPNLVEVARHVNWVHFPSAGVDGVASEVFEGRIVTSSRGVSADAIAEFVMAAILAYEKHVPDVWIDQPPDAWASERLGALRERKLGLVGVGAIAHQIARRALAFDMEVRATRRRVADRWAELPTTQIVALDELLAWADHLVLAVPATSSTTNLISDPQFALVQPGVHLINIARGSLIDQDALRRALDQQRVARATLDVCTPEPLPRGHWLYSHPSVRLSPHVSWSGADLSHRVMVLFLENVRRWLNGEDLLNVVNSEHGY